jgi:hypothetical protein
MKLNLLKVSALWSMLAVAGNVFGQADQLLPPIGGGGGAQYSARCASHEIVNGFELRTGDDVDAIRPICAPIDTAKVIGARRLHPDS